MSAWDWQNYTKNAEMSKNWLGVNAKETSFLGLLQLLDEITMIRFMGRDLTIYLKFLNNSYVMFFIILLIEWTVLIPLYYSGTDAEQYLEAEVEYDLIDNSNSTALRFLETANSTSGNQTRVGNFTLAEDEAQYNLVKFTILNIQNDTGKMTIAYAMVMLTTVIVYLQIFCFWKTTYSWRDKTFVYGEDAKLGMLHKYAVMVRGIPKNLTPEEAGDNIKRILNAQKWNKLIDKAGDEQKIVEVLVVGDYKQIYSMGKKWDDIQEQISRSIKYERLLQMLDDFNTKGELERADYLTLLD